MINIHYTSLIRWKCDRALGDLLYTYNIERWLFLIWIVHARSYKNE